MAFYDVFLAECQRKGVRPGKAASACGINRSNVTNWKKNGYTPRGDALQRIADYFGISVDQLLNGQTEMSTLQDEHTASKEEILFALFRGREDLVSDSIYEEVQSFADFLVQREDRKKNK